MGNDISPQLENGYTPIANEIMDALSKTRIPGEARQVLDFILRKTYGWQKKDDKISLSQFIDGTGLKKNTICRALVKLKAMNLIVTKKENDSITTYYFNKHYKAWKPLPKKRMIHKKENLDSQKREFGFTKKRHTKAITTKTTITKTNYVAFSTDDLKLATLLSDLMTKNNPTRKPTSDSQLKSWAKEVRLMREQDNRSNEDIEEHIIFSQADDFFKPWVLSMKKLREKYDTLTIRIEEREKKKRSFTSNTPILR